MGAKKARDLRHPQFAWSVLKRVNAYRSFKRFARQSYILARLASIEKKLDIILATSQEQLSKRS